MKTLRKMYLPFFLLVFVTVALNSQSFVTPLSSISGDAEVLTTDNQTITGKITMAMLGMKGLTSLTMKDTSGEKHSFKAADILTLKIKVDGLAKLEMISEKTKNLDKLLNAKFDEVVDRKYIYYEQVTIPGKDKQVMVQLLNPGFCNRIKVFDKAGAKTGETSVNGMAVSGGENTSYYVVRGSDTYEITRSKYKKEQFDMLFGDCPDLVTNYPDKDFKDFAEHVLFYEVNCR